MKRTLAGFACLLCALAVAASAYGAHAADPLVARRLSIAAAFAFGHGLALLLLRARDGRLARAAQCALALGALFFAGSLAGAALFSLPTVLAPAGGSLLILGWLLAAADFLHRD